MTVKRRGGSAGRRVRKEIGDSRSLDGLWHSSQEIGVDELRETATLISHIAANRKNPENRLKAVFKRLSPRQREIVKLRFGISNDRPYTLAECAVIFRITRERVRQVQMAALRIVCMLFVDKLRQIAGKEVEQKGSSYILTQKTLR